MKAFRRVTTVGNSVRSIVILTCIALGATSLAFGLGGCSTTQCAVAQRAFETAQVGYSQALASGHTAQIDQYWWAVGAAQAMMTFWCSTQGEELQP